MKEKYDRSGKNSSPGGGDDMDRLINNAMRSLGWLMPLTEAAVRQTRDKQEGDDEWPSLLFEIPEDRSAAHEASSDRSPTPLIIASGTEDFSLAVLPFTTESDTGASSIVLDIADSLTTRLGAAGLSIIRPTSTTLKFNIPDDPSKAGLSMDVKYVIDGNVTQTEAGLHVKTRFVSVLNRELLWETTHTGYSHDVIGVENSVTEEVALIIQPHLAEELRARLRKRPTESTQAYLKFKEGRHLFNQFSKQGLNSAVGLFEEAITHDPQFADAYACAGETLLWLVLLGLVDSKANPAEMLSRSRRYLDQALRFDHTLANAHTTKAFLDLIMGYAWAEAALGFLRALEFDANCAFAHLGLSLILTSQKMFTEALAEIEYALAIDPKSLICNVFKGLIYFQARDWQSSLEQFERTLSLHKTLSEHLRGTLGSIPPDTIYYGQALAYVGLGRLEEARKAAKKAARYSHGHRLKQALLAYVYILLGRRNEAEEILKGISIEEKESHIPFHIALVYAALCETDHVNKEQHAAEAFRYLRLAGEKRDFWMLWLVVDPRLDVLRSDLTRFESLLCDTRLPPPGAI